MTVSCINFAIFLLAALFLTGTIQCRPSKMQFEQNEKSHDNVRNRRLVDEILKDKAYEYYKQLHADHLCLLPQQRILSVQKIHPTNAVTYTTGSVLLHRCAEDTGCCAPSEVCVAKTTKNVEIPILVTKAGDEDVQAQMMTFVHHTECHCVLEMTLTKS